MLKFRQFVNENKEPIEQGVMVDGVPNVLIDWKRATQGAMVDGVPNVFVDWDRKRPVTEKTNKPSWESVNDNDHIGDHEKVRTHLRVYDTSKADDQAHTKRYSEDSSTLNRQLFINHKYGHPHYRHIAGHDTDGLDKALKRNKLNTDLHVYSGVGFHPGHMAAKHPDGHVHLAAYTSTSISKHVAKEFAQPDDDGDSHILHIHLKKGQTGKYLKDHHHTLHPHEDEFLMPRNTTLKIHPTPDIHEDSYGTRTHIWHAEVVKPKKK